MIIPEHLQLLMRLESIFMPYATRQRRKLYARADGLPNYLHESVPLSV